MSKLHNFFWEKQFQLFALDFNLSFNNFFALNLLYFIENF